MKDEGGTMKARLSWIRFHFILHPSVVRLAGVCNPPLRFLKISPALK
jgi:hypothetical protein